MKAGRDNTSGARTFINKFSGKNRLAKLLLLLHCLIQINMLENIILFFSRCNYIDRLSESLP